MSRPKSQISQVPADRKKPHHRGAMFMEGIPKSTKDDFKAACAKNGKVMRDIFIELMRDYAIKAGIRQPKKKDPC